MIESRPTRQQAENVLLELATPVEPVQSKFKGPRISESWEESLREIVSEHRRRGQESGQGQPRLRILLAGQGGRERTLMAASIAGELGTTLYRADLADLVTRFGAGTEESLRRLLEAAAQAECLLMLDNADSLIDRESANIASSAAIDLSGVLRLAEGQPGPTLLGAGLDAEAVDGETAARLDFVLSPGRPGI